MSARKPVAIERNGGVVVCDDGSVWERVDRSNVMSHRLTPSDLRWEWVETLPIPGTERAHQWTLTKGRPT